jgi:hypothetical protein
VPDSAARTMRAAYRTNLFGLVMTVWCLGAALLPVLNPLVRNVSLGVVLKKTLHPYINAEDLQ